MYSNVLRFFAIQRYTSKIEIIWLIKKFFPARISYLGFKSPVHVNKKYTIDFSSLESATVSWYCSTDGSPPEMSMLHSAVVNRNTYIYWEFFLLTFLVCNGYLTACKCMLTAAATRISCGTTLWQSAFWNCTPTASDYQGYQKLSLHRCTSRSKLMIVFLKLNPIAVHISCLVFLV